LLTAPDFAEMGVYSVYMYERLPVAENGDLCCSTWNFLGMAGLGEQNWTPRYKYWTRPQKMDGGGQSLFD
jgi:hypothetical protein